MADEQNILGKKALGTYEEVLNPMERLILEEGNLGNFLQENKDATNALTKFNRMERTTEESVAQGVKDVGKGLTSAIGGLITAGAVGTDALTGLNTAPTVNEGVGFLTGALDKLDDPKRLANQPIAQAKSKEIARINEEKHGDTWRGAVGSAVDTLSNMNSEDVFGTTGEGVGSFLAPMAILGKGGKGVSAVEGAVAKQSVKGQASHTAEEIASKSIGKVDKAVEALTDSSVLAKFGGKRHLATMGLIGGMEGGSQAGEFISRVFDTPYQDLYDGSKQFRDLINAGYTEEEARKAVAKTGATQVLIEVGLIATALSAGVAKFESAPFKMGTVSSAMGNIGRETVEETSQSASGAYLTNRAIQDYVDKDAKAWEGVGEQSAHGLVGGITSAGLVQAPSIGVATAKNAVNKTVNSVDRIFPEKPQTSETLKIPATKGEAIDMAESLKGKSFEEVFEYAGVKDPRTFGRSKEQYLNMTRNKDSKEDMKTVAKMSMIADMISLDVPVDQVKEIAPYVSIEELRSNNQVDDRGNVSPIAVILNAMDMVESGKSGVENPQQEMIKLFDTLGQMYETRIKPFAEVFGDVDVDSLVDTSTPEGQSLANKVSTFQNAMDSANPEGLKGYFDQAQEVMQAVKERQAQSNPEEFIKQHVNLDSLFGKEIASKGEIETAKADIDMALNLMQNNPKSNKAFIAKLQAMRGIIDLYSDTASSTENQIFNNKAILNEDMDSDIGSNNVRSFREYLADIHEASKTNDQDNINQKLIEMGAFVRHLRNKANAINESASKYSTDENGKNTSFNAQYDVLSPKTRTFDSTNTTAVHLHSPASVQYARSVLQNANDASRIYNLAVDAYANGKAPKTKEIKAHQSLIDNPNFEPINYGIQENTVTEVPKTEQAPVQEVKVEPTEAPKVEEVVTEPVKSEEVSKPVEEQPIKEESKEETTEETTEESNEESITEEDVDNWEEYSLSEVYEDAETSFEGFDLVTLEDADSITANEQINEQIKTASENITDIDTLVEYIDTNIETIPANDISVRDHIGSEAFELVELFKKPELDIHKVVDSTFGNIFTDLGMNNSTLVKMFVEGKKGSNGKVKYKFNRGNMIGFLRKTANFLNAFKQQGYLDKGFKLNQTDITDGSMEAYAVLRSLVTAMDDNAKRTFNKALNTKTAKSKNTLLKNLLHKELTNGNHDNTLIEGLMFNTDSISPAVLATSPLDAMWNFTRSGMKNNAVATMKFSGLSTKPKLLRNYEKLSKAIIEGVKEQLESFTSEILNRPVNKSENLANIMSNNMMSKFGSVPLNYQERFKTLNALSEDGKLHMDDRIVEAYSMAVLDSYFEHISGDRQSEVIENFSFNEDGELYVTRSDLRDFTTNELVRNIVSKANSILGVRYNKNAPEGVTEGTSFAIASDILDAFQHVMVNGANVKDKGIVQKVFQDSLDGKSKIFIGYTFDTARVVETPALAELVSIASNLFSESSKQASEPAIRTVPAKVEKGEKVRNSRDLPINKSDRENLTRLNEIPSTLNESMVSHVLNGKVNALAEWLDDGIISSIKSDFTVGNKKKLISDMSKFNTVQSSLEHIAKMAGISDSLKEMGHDTVQFFTKYGKGGENRNHAEGSMNAQTNKIIRELVSPNESTLDLSSDNMTTHTFLTAIAQGLGYKVNNLNRKNVAEDLLRKMSIYAPSMELINKHLKDGTSPINFKVINQIKADSLMEDGSSKKHPDAIDRTMVSLHNLIDLTRYLNATKEDLKSFNTWVYLEVDGVTKGVGDTMAIYNTHPEYVPTASDKTGTIYSDNTTEFQNRVYNPKNDDIYVTGGKGFSKRMTKYFNQGSKIFPSFNELLKKNNGLFGSKGNVDSEKTKTLVAGAVGTVISAFDIGISSDNGNLSVARKFSKKPVMVINYGSGVQSVARSLVNLIHEELLDRFDKVAKELQQNDKPIDQSKREQALQIFFDNEKSLKENMSTLKGMANALDLLNNTQYKLNEEGFPIKDVFDNKVMEFSHYDSKNSNIFKQLLQDVTSQPDVAVGDYLNGSKLSNMTGFAEILGEPISQAVKEISSEAHENMSLLASINDSSSRIMAVLFEEAIQEKLNQVLSENPHRIRKNGLSANEYAEVVTAMRIKFGTINTGSGRIDLFNFSQTPIENRNSHTAQTAGMTDPKGFNRYIERTSVKKLGVSTSALMSIGTEGDMLNNFLKIAPKELLDKIVPIHDGYNVSGDPYLTDMLSLLMNLSAIHSWDNNNPFASTIEYHNKLIRELKGHNNFLNIVSGFNENSYDDPTKSYKRYKKAWDKVQVLGQEKVKPSSNGIVTNAMNGADIPVVVTADGRTNVIPLLRALYVAKANNQSIDIKKLAMSDTIVPEAYSFDELAKDIKSGKFRSDSLSYSKTEQSTPAPTPIVEATKVETKTIKPTQYLESVKDSEYHDALETIMKSPKLKNIAFFEGTKNQLKDLGIQNSSDFSDANGAYLHGNSMIWMNTEGKYDKGRTLYHEVIHATTSHIVIDALMGSNQGYDAKTFKLAQDITNNLLGQANRLKDYMESKPMESFSDEALVLYDNHLRMLDNNSSLYTKAKAVLELIAYGAENNDLRKVIAGMKVDKNDVSLKEFKSISDQFNKYFGQLKAIILSVLGFKDFRSIKSELTRMDFNREALIRLAKDYMPDTNPPPKRGKKVKDIEATTEAGKGIQESLNLFQNSPNRGVSAYQQGIIDSNMDVAEASGFLTPDQRVEASAIAHTIEYSKKTDPVVFSRIAEIYEEILKNLTPKDFINTQSPTARDLAMADIQYDYIKNLPKGVNSISTFAGVASVSPILQGILSNTLYDKSSNKQNIKQRLDQLSNQVVDALYDRSLNVLDTPSDAQAHLNRLVTKLDALSTSKDNFVENSLNSLSGYVDQANNMILDKLDSLSEKAYQSTKDLRKSNFAPIRYIGHLSAVPRLVYADKDTTQIGMNGVMKFVSGENVPRFFRELVSDIVGRTNFSGNVYDMIKTVKSKVQALRQQFREEVPKMLKEAYSRQLLDHETKAISEGVLSTDLSSLLDHNSIDDIFEYLSNPSSRTNKIRDLEGYLQNNYPSFQSNLFIRKSKELAEYMMTKKTSYNLLTNADLIAHLTGENTNVNNPETIVHIIDQLVSLYAIGHVNTKTMSTLKNLVNSESKGLTNTIQYSRGIVKADIDSKQATDLSRNNRLKGYTSMTNTKPTTIVQVKREDVHKYEQMGYVRVTDALRDKVYMMIDVRTKGVFHQGIIQTVRPSVGGADAFSGMLHGLSYDGLITDKQSVARISNLIASQRPGYENFRPVYRNAGDSFPYAYQELPPKKVLDYLSLETDFSKQLANYTGRKVEESIAVASNKALVTNLNEMYLNSDEASKRRDFVDILNTESLKKDPVLRDAVNLIPPTMKKYLKSLNQESLYVRRDMLNDVTGYRMAMVGDFWSGNNRFKTDIQKSVVKALESVIGKGTFKKLMKAQYGVQSIMADVRDIIVIRTAIVPIINILSNMAQALTRGISPFDVVKGYIEKSKEISRYVEIKKRITQLEAQRIIHYSDKAKIKDINARISMLEESIKKLSISPLIEAGEYSSIADLSIDKNDTGILEGGLLSYLERKADSLPTGLDTVAKYAIMSRDTAIYDVLKKATDYGDFIAKSIYYDKQLKRGVPKAEAMAQVREEFVNYDKLQGRTRHTLENLGLMWFWNWKLRATKTMASILKNNPLNALIYSMSPLQGLNGIGTPIEESFASRIFGEKSLTYSLGLTQALNSWTGVPATWAFK